MKLILGLIMLLCFIDAQADVIKVNKMTRESGWDARYVLITNLKKNVALDCQSFIQGLEINDLLSVLDPDECEALQGRMRASLSRFQKHCIDLEDGIRADYTCS